MLSLSIFQCLICEVYITHILSLTLITLHDIILVWHLWKTEIVKVEAFIFIWQSLEIHSEPAHLK